MKLISLLGFFNFRQTPLNNIQNITYYAIKQKKYSEIILLIRSLLFHFLDKIL